MGIDLVSRMAGLCWCRQNYHSICRFSDKVGSTSTLLLLIPCKFGKRSIRNTMTTNLEEFEFRANKGPQMPLWRYWEENLISCELFFPRSPLFHLPSTAGTAPLTLVCTSAVCLWVLCGSQLTPYSDKERALFHHRNQFSSYPWGR